MKITKKLRARPRKWYSWDHVILDGTQEVTLLKLSAFLKNGTAVIGDVEYQFGREGVLSGSYFVRTGEDILAKAEKRSVFRDRYIILHEEVQYELRLVSVFRSSYVLFEKNREVGTISRESFFSTTTFIKLPEDIPIPLMIFIFWLVLQSRARRSRRS